MTLLECEEKIKSAFEKAVAKEEAIERAGGSSEEIYEARARADAYSDCLVWIEQVRP